MDYGNMNMVPKTAEKQGETAEFLRATDELANWSPERDMGAIGNLARNASSSQPPSGPDNLGVIMPTDPAPSGMIKPDTIPIHLSWSDQEGTRLNSNAINAIKNRERKLAADGDIKGFYNDIRASVMSTQKGGDK